MPLPLCAGCASSCQGFNVSGDDSENVDAVGKVQHNACEMLCVVPIGLVPWAAQELR